MKIQILVLLSILCVLINCQNKQVELELDKYQSITEIEQQNLEIVRRWIEEVNVNNFEKLYEELFSKEFRHYVPSNSEPKSYEDYKEIGQHIYPAFPYSPFHSPISRSIARIKMEVADSDPCCGILPPHPLDLHPIPIATIGPRTSLK